MYYDTHMIFSPLCNHGHRAESTQMLTGDAKDSNLITLQLGVITLNNICLFNNIIRTNEFDL